MRFYINKTLIALPFYLLVALPSYAANTYSSNTLCTYPETHPKKGELAIPMRDKSGATNAKPTNVKAAYLKALFKANALAVDPSILSNPETNIFYSPANMAKYLSGCQISSDASCAAGFAIYSDIAALFTQDIEMISGFFLAGRQNSSNKPLTVSELGKFLNEDGGYALYCKQMSGIPPMKSAGDDEDKAKLMGADLDVSSDGWVVAGDIDSIHKATKDKKAASLSLDLDRANKTKYKLDSSLPLEGDNVGITKNEKVSASIVVAFPGSLRLLKPHQNGVTSIESFVDQITPYAQLEYESNIDPKVETDNLSFGLAWNRKLGWNDLSRDVGEIHPLFGSVRLQSEFDRFLLNARYITDIEERKSQQYFYDFKVPMANVSASLWDFDLLAGISAVFDGSDIDEVNDKVALNKLKTFGRTGYDVEFSAHVPDVLDWHMDTNIKYFYRDSFGKNDADADKWEFVFGIKPDADSTLSFELKYDRGEVLTSLEEVESWKFGLGYKH